MQGGRDAPRRECTASQRGSVRESCPAPPALVEHVDETCRLLSLLTLGRSRRRNDGQPFLVNRSRIIEESGPLSSSRIRPIALTPPDITRLLVAWGQGDAAALDRLIPIVHDELHRIARGCVARE